MKGAREGSSCGWPWVPPVAPINWLRRRPARRLATRINAVGADRDPVDLGLPWRSHSMAGPERLPADRLGDLKPPPGRCCPGCPVRLLLCPVLVGGGKPALPRGVRLDLDPLSVSAGLPDRGPLYREQMLGVRWHRNRYAAVTQRARARPPRSRSMSFRRALG